MQKRAAILVTLFMLVFLSGCGGGSSTTTAAIPIYDGLPSSLAPADTHMGGAIQVTPLTLPKTVSTLAGTAGIPGTIDTSTGLGTDARFNQPNGITTDGAFLYVADYKNNMIRRIDLSTKNVKTLAGTGVAGYAESTGADGTTATFNAPSDITVAGGYLYVADSGNNVIRRVDKANGETHILAGSTTGIAGSVDSKTVPTDARFNHPTGITTDGVSLYVTDYGNNTIRRILIPPDTITVAAVTTMAGAPATAGSVDGTQSIARFNQPARITTDGTYLYVTDLLNRTIRKIEILTGKVTTIAGISGPLDSAGNIADSTDGTGATARFYQPNGITTDGANLYVTDSYNNSVRKIVLSNGTVLSGPVTTIIHGTGLTPGSAEGVDGTAKFNTPIGITTNGSALYIADSYNHTIRMIE